MIRQASLINGLVSILGGESVLPHEETEKYAVDGLLPQAVVAPDNVEAVAEVMRFAHKQGLAVIPWGGGTMMGLGNLPRRYDLALSLSRLDQVIEHEPADLTVSVQAGLTLAEFQRQLATAGQFLALDPPLPEAATVGGVLAANASGPCRHAYGSARDITLGLRVITADGRLTRTGGKVVKNVAGYDLCKLYIGSLGTLGIIVEASFKLWPLPRAAQSAILFFAAAAAACAAASELHGRGLSLQAMDLLNAPALARLGIEGPAAYALALCLAGSPPAVARSLNEARHIARGMGASLQEAAGEAHDRLWQAIGRLAVPASDGLLCRATVPSSRLPQLLADIQAMGSEATVVARPALGIAYAAWPTGAVGESERIIEALRAVTAGLGGTLVVEGCSPALKERIDVWGQPPPPSLALMERVKQQFDPKGILNPGRFVGGL